MSIELSGIWTLALALVTIEIGKCFNRRLAWLERSNVPPAVSAGLVVSLLLGSSSSRHRHPGIAERFERRRSDPALPRRRGDH